MSDTPTPRTDAAASAGGHQLLNVATVARNLERENAKLRRAGNAMAEYLEPGSTPASAPSERDYLLAAWEEATMPDATSGLGIIP